ncbi:MAG: BMC domain-containing protein [Deltaproteobacteria bacterium]|nr:BMC domain-containing protein [Deltaproteobacteria bacterium]
MVAVEPRVTEELPTRPALACIEVTSIARGTRMVDELCKRAPVHLLEAATICPGKYLAVFGGDEAATSESYQRGLEVAGPTVVDQLLLPNAHPQLFPAIEATGSVGELLALGVVETFAVASAILAADAACKRSPIQLIELRLARGLGGKAFFTLTGDLADVEASVKAAEEILERSSGLLLRTEVIARPHRELARWII